MTRPGRTIRIVRLPADWDAPDPARYGNIHALADMAATIAVDRITRGAAQVAAGRLTAEAHATRCRVAAAQSSLWAAIVAGDMLPRVANWPDLAGASLAELRDDMADTVRRAKAQFGSVNPKPPELIERTKLVEGLAWHLGPPAETAQPRLLALADLLLVDAIERRDAA